jgi:hypothetical protein
LRLRRSKGNRWFDPVLPEHPLFSCVDFRFCQFPEPKIMALADIRLRFHVRVCSDCSRIRDALADRGTPTDHVMFCPRCLGQHIDSGVWATREHRVHLCEFCGERWMPSVNNTRGVPIPPGRVEVRSKGIQYLGDHFTIHREPYDGPTFRAVLYTDEMEAADAERDRLIRIYVQGLYP